MSQLVFSGAANYKTFDGSNPEEEYFGIGNAATSIARQMNKSGISFVKGTEVEKIPMWANRPVVNFSFCYPHEHQFRDYEYKIGYTPWESTEIFPQWYDMMYACNEIWTTSAWSKSNLERVLNIPVFLYEHGVPKICSPKKTKFPDGEPFRFMHIGEPGARKGAQEVVTAFAKLFGNNPNYQLIVKCTGINTTRILDQWGASLGTPGAHYSNILVIEDMLSEKILFELYRRIHAFVYPSWGEGFGFNPLQAMGMGIPTICTAEWAPYADLITAPLDSKYVNTPWPILHPGQMVQPNVEQLENYMIDISQDYERYSKLAFKNSLAVHEKYNWDKVSKTPLKRLKKIISMTSK